jgi:hypothetical protein
MSEAAATTARYEVEYLSSSSDSTQRKRIEELCSMISAPGMPSPERLHTFMT